MAIDGTLVDQGALDAMGDDTVADGNVAVVTIPTVADDDVAGDDDDAMEETHTKSEGQDAISTEMRDIDLVEERRVDAFVDKGCGCKYFNGRECSSAFTREHISIRGQCSAMTRPELQNVLFGHVMATVRTNSTMERRGHASKERERNRHHVTVTCIIYSITGLQEYCLICPQYWC